MYYSDDIKKLKVKPFVCVLGELIDPKEQSPKFWFSDTKLSNILLKLLFPLLFGLMI